MNLWMPDGCTIILSFSRSDACWNSLLVVSLTVLGEWTTVDRGFNGLDGVGAVGVLLFLASMGSQSSVGTRLHWRQRSVIICLKDGL